jgi:Restriction endonuclease
MGVEVDGLDLPQPKNWQDFEAIVCNAMSQRWKSPNLQKNGRSGQKQAGVDIYGPDDIGRRVGIQCKRYKGSLKLKRLPRPKPSTRRG